jgi:hypothetical protein
VGNDENRRGLVAQFSRSIDLSSQVGAPAGFVHPRRLIGEGPGSGTGEVDVSGAAAAANPPTSISDVRTAGAAGICSRPVSRRTREPSFLIRSVEPWFFPGSRPAQRRWSLELDDRRPRVPGLLRWPERARLRVRRRRQATLRRRPRRSGGQLSRADRRRRPRHRQRKRVRHRDRLSRPPRPGIRPRSCPCRPRSAGCPRPAPPAPPGRR